MIQQCPACGSDQLMVFDGDASSNDRLYVCSVCETMFSTPGDITYAGISNGCIMFKYHDDKEPFVAAWRLNSGPHSSG